MWMLLSSRGNDRSSPAKTTFNLFILSFPEGYSAWDAHMLLWMKQKTLLSSSPTWMYLQYNNGKQRLLHNEHSSPRKLISSELKNNVIIDNKSSQAYQLDFSCLREQDMWELQVAEIFRSAFTRVSHLRRHNMSTAHWAQSCVWATYDAIICCLMQFNC